MKHAVVLVLALAACTQQRSNDTAAASTNTAQGNYIAEVTALPPGQLRGVLYRAIVDGGETCQAIQDFAREPDRDGKPTWSARCKEGSEWVIVLGNDGIAQVTGASVRR